MTTAQATTLFDYFDADSTYRETKRGLSWLTAGPHGIGEAKQIMTGTRIDFYRHNGQHLGYALEGTCC